MTHFYVIFLDCEKAFDNGILPTPFPTNIKAICKNPTFKVIQENYESQRYSPYLFIWTTVPRYTKGNNDPCHSKNLPRDQFSRTSTHSWHIILYNKCLNRQWILTSFWGTFKISSLKTWNRIMGSATTFPSTATEEIDMESKWTSPKGQSILVPSLMLWILNVVTFSGKHFAIQGWKKASLWSFNHCKAKKYQQICHGIFKQWRPGPENQIAHRNSCLASKRLKLEKRYCLPQKLLDWRPFSIFPASRSTLGKNMEKRYFLRSVQDAKLFRKCRCEKKFLVTVTPTKLQSKNLEEAKTGSKYRKWM